MDELYERVRGNLKKFIYDAFGLEVSINPKSVNYVDEVEDNADGVYNVLDDTIDVKKNTDLEKVLAHELLHHLGHKSGYEVLSPLHEEYPTELLTQAFLKYIGRKEKVEDSSPDEIPIYIGDDPYTNAIVDATGKTWERIVELYKAETTENEDPDVIQIYI